MANSRFDRYIYGTDKLPVKAAGWTFNAVALAFVGGYLLKNWVDNKQVGING